MGALWSGPRELHLRETTRWQGQSRQRSVWALRPAPGSTSRQLPAPPHSAEPRQPRLSPGEQVPRAHGLSGGPRPEPGLVCEALSPSVPRPRRAPPGMRCAHLGLGFRLDPERGHGRDRGPAPHEEPGVGTGKGKRKQRSQPARSSWVVGRGEPEEAGTARGGVGEEEGSLGWGLPLEPPRSISDPLLGLLAHARARLRALPACGLLACCLRPSLPPPSISALLAVFPQPGLGQRYALRGGAVPSFLTWPFFPSLANVVCWLHRHPLSHEVTHRRRHHRWSSPVGSSRTVAANAVPL